MLILLLILPVHGTFMLYQFLILIKLFLIFQNHVLGEKLPNPGNIIRKFVIKVSNFIFGYFLLS